MMIEFAENLELKVSAYDAAEKHFR